MKTNTLKAVAAVGLSALLMGSAAAQSVSQPVGYETLNYTSGFNYLGLRLVEAPAGAGAALSISGGDVTLADGVVDALDAATSYIFEVTSGDAAGAVTTISAFDATANTVSLADDISGDFDGGDEFIIRPTSTLSSVFGETNDVANSGSGLTSAGSFAGCDQIWIPDGSGSFQRYAFVLGNPFAGTSDSWQDDLGNVINPDLIELNYVDGVIVNAISPGDFVVSGSIKLEAVQIALTTTFNYLGSLFPAGLTLEESELVNTLTSAGSFAGCDQVWLPDSSGGFLRYAFVLGNPFAGTPDAWQDDSGTLIDPETISFDDTPGMIVVRAGSAVSMITVDSPDFYDTL